MRGLLTQSRPEWADGKRIPSNVGSPHIGYTLRIIFIANRSTNRLSVRFWENPIREYMITVSLIHQRTGQNICITGFKTADLFEVLPQIFVEFPMRIYIFELRKAATNQSTDYKLYQQKNLTLIYRLPTVHTYLYKIRILLQQSSYFKCLFK